MPAPARAAQTPCMCSSTVWGLTGATLTEATDVLAHGARRIGLHVMSTNGGSGNPLDGLDEPGADSGTARLARGTLALGLARDAEIAVMAPYVQLTPEDRGGTGGRGDLGLSLKQRVWNAGPQRPAVAVSASYVAATAARDRSVNTVTHDAYRFAVALQSTRALRSPWAEAVTVTGNLGALLKDQLRVERDEILLYAVGAHVLLPKEMGGLFDRDTGLFGRGADGRYAVTLEAAGTYFRGDRAPTYDDSITLIAGVRYTAARWGIAVSAHSVTYSRQSKHHAAGGGILGAVAF
ncbi:MAG: hypothetical protein ACOYXR_11600 [Nitrospirota bacterium]